MSIEGTMDRARRRLGRGLSSLIGDPVAVPVRPPAEAAKGGNVSVDLHVPAEAASKAAPAIASPTPRGANEGGGVEFVDVGAITPSRFQPRREMDPAALQRLTDSIRRSGLMQPIIVRPASGGVRPANGSPAAGASGGGQQYELVAGERRWRAAQRAGLARVPAIVRPLSDEESAEWGLVENLQREDLNAMDRAYSLRTLCDRFGLSQAQAAERVGLDRSSVANLIRLLELEAPIAALIAGGKLDAGHGKALLGVAPGAPRSAMAARAASQEWSVRQLEREAAKAASPARAGVAAPALDARRAARNDMERRLGEHLGTKVGISTDRSGRKGRITIEFFDLDHFDGLMSKLGIQLS
ncbi:MAG: ParB/RepB/Spo0J family partition protein [Phycisphaerales bacterium]